MGSKHLLNVNSYLNLVAGVLSFVIIIDPPNTYLHLKDPLFVLLLFSCLILKKPSYWFFLPLVLAIFTWLASSINGYCSCDITDLVFNIGILKAILPFVILGWIKYLNFTKYLTLPCCVISIISILVYLAMLYSPELELALYNHFTEENGLMMISRRSFVGINMASAFYRSTPLIIFPLSIALEKYLIRKNKKYKLVSLILFLGLFAGGNRACMLSALGILTIVYFIKLYEQKKIRLLFSFIIVFLLLTSVVLFILLNDSQEESNVVKFGHLTSYIKLFDDNPGYLFIGQGAGSLFYSCGFKTFTVQTEWTYIELIRYFGLLGGSIILGIFLFPLFRILKNHTSYPYNGLTAIISYILYLLLAGTNPLLLSSTGLIACLYNYSYIFYGRKQ